jgi:hypothetical protein
MSAALDAECEAPSDIQVVCRIFGRTIGIATSSPDSRHGAGSNKGIKLSGRAPCGQRHADVPGPRLRRGVA